MQFMISIIVALFQFMPLMGCGDAQAVGQALAQEAVYSVYTIPGTDDRSILIQIPLDDTQFLQLYSPAVLRAFSFAALQVQEDAVPDDTPYLFLLMNVRHIAGETKLHLVGYVVTYLTGGEDGLFPALHESFRVVDLNVDEDRIPPWFMRFVGWTIVRDGLPRRSEPITVSPADSRRFANMFT